MSRKSMVVFDLGGVLLCPAPQQKFHEYEERLNLPGGFLQSVILTSGPNGAFIRAELGKITLSQFLSEFEQECKDYAGNSKVSLPANFSIQHLFEEIAASFRINEPMLNASIKLHNNGFKTCILTNNWVDDTDHKDVQAQLLCTLQQHFDLIVESCRVGLRKPQSDIYTLALAKLNATPEQVIFLDDIGANLKSARELGMSTVLVDDTKKALEELQRLTGVQLLSPEEPLPPCCHPEDVTHGFVKIKPGVQIHYVELGDGPPLCLCHGFPESWFSWRYQISALAAAGFRVLALDMKGYGDSTAPPDIEEYGQEEICKDFVTFLDKLGLPQVTLIGHDWGGAFVWNMAQFYPERVRAVASLNTPLFPVDPNSDPMERLRALPIFDYQLYFQEPGVAEAELEADLRRTFKIMFCGHRDMEQSGAELSTSGVCKRGGLLVGLPKDVPRSSILSESTLQFYVQQYEKSGFRGPLNWYRNVRKNWQWLCTKPMGKIQMPALMVTAGKDMVLLPAFTKGMEDLIPKLTRGHIEECSHWTQMDRPAEVNKILIQWLKDTHKSATLQMKTRL
ncbi:bifunctional epoxide hydrolase 2 isoform X1 [Polypterus senegalus]|nr:bifunctional epoxide hydrolase 2 isoform X1 [Polypterus senegalus]